MKQRQRLAADIVVPFILVALVFGGLIWQKYREASRLPATPPGKQEAAARHRVVLFFTNDQGQLAREAREIDRCEDQTSCLRATLEELFSGPVGDLEDAIPEWASISDVRIEGDLAVIDLGVDFLEGLAATKSAETLAVYSIVNTVCSNQADVKKVLITIGGNQPSRLRHLDLSAPLTPDYTLEAPAAQPAPEGK